MNELQQILKKAIIFFSNFVTLNAKIEKRSFKTNQNPDKQIQP